MDVPAPDDRDLGDEHVDEAQEDGAVDGGTSDAAADRRDRRRRADRSPSPQVRHRPGRRPR
ncbi:hypothetical protein WDZ17_02060 [Pseudokineococcus basanitobsidens]|uniref:Uncharacterized protein n=1 Tax=Pseudokineococcus basanitobsidens TaxID=1926649 RepID=A0ABU8RG80_9ACTN